MNRDRTTRTRNLGCFVLLLAAVLSGCGGDPNGDPDRPDTATTVEELDPPDAATFREMVPRGDVIVVGVADKGADGLPTPVFVIPNERGPQARPEGPAADLLDALAEHIGVRVQWVVGRNTNAVVEEVQAGRVDVAIVPADPARAAVLGVAEPSYFSLDSTGLVAAALAGRIRTLADIDNSRERLRLVANANSTTFRAADARWGSQHDIQTVPQPADALVMLVEGSNGAARQADIYFQPRENLLEYQAQLPGSTVLPGDIVKVPAAMVVPQNRTRAVRYVSRFMAHAVNSGLVRQAFVDSGLQALLQ